METDTDTDTDTVDMNASTDVDWQWAGKEIHKRQDRLTRSAAKLPQLAGDSVKGKWAWQADSQQSRLAERLARILT